MGLSICYHRQLGHKFRICFTSSPMGVAKSGVKGPLTWGSRVARSISMSWSYSQPASGESKA